MQEEYVTRRKQFKRVKLRWRVSGGKRRSLGWIPFKAVAIRYQAGQVWYGGQALSLWDSYGLAGLCCINLHVIDSQREFLLGF